MTDHRLIGGPKSTAIGFQQTTNNVAEGFRIGAAQAIGHGSIEGVGFGGSVIDPAIGKIRGAAPTQQGRHPLGNFKGPAGTLGGHGFGPLGIQQFGAIFQPQEAV